MYRRRSVVQIWHPTFAETHMWGKRPATMLAIYTGKCFALEVNLREVQNRGISGPKRWKCVQQLPRGNVEILTRCTKTLTIVAKDILRTKKTSDLQTPATTDTTVSPQTSKKIPQTRKVLFCQTFTLNHKTKIAK